MIVLTSAAFVLSLSLIGCGGNATYDPILSGPKAKPTLSVGNVSTFEGLPVTVTATVTGATNPAVTWSVVTEEGGSISSTGPDTGSFTSKLFTDTVKFNPMAKSNGLFNSIMRSHQGMAAIGHPRWESNQEQVTIKATLNEDPSITATAVVTVNATTVTIVGQPLTVVQDNFIGVSAIIDNGAVTGAISWFMNSAGNQNTVGSITSTGQMTANYFAPAENTGVFSIEASTTVDAGASGFADVTVTQDEG